MAAETSAAATSVAPTTVQPTDAPPSGAVAEPADDLEVGEASIATVGGTVPFTVVAGCRSTVTLGLQAESALLTNSSGAVYVIDIFLEEGATTRSAEITDMSESIASFLFGQDTPGNNSRWTAELAEPSLIDRLSFEAADGTSPSINVSARLLDPSECGQGFFGSPSPFPGDGPIEFIEQFDEAFSGTGFALLAACSDASFVTSGGGLLSQNPDDGAFFTATYYVEDPENPEDSVFWTTNEDFTFGDQLIEQFGGGGDTLFATNVVNADGSQSGYLQFTRQPTVPGGLAAINCAN